MAREQTVYSELAVSLGILGFEENQIDELAKIRNVSDKDIDKYDSEHKKSKRKEIGKKLVIAGKAIREKANAFGLTSPSITWVGSQATGVIENAAKDIEIDGLVPTRISVKEESDKLINGSPKRVFTKYPLGEFEKSKSNEHWYLDVAAETYQDYFLACDGPKLTGKTTISDFEKLKQKDCVRESFRVHVKSLHEGKTKKTEVVKAYKNLCEAVSEKSATIFNSNIETVKKSTDGQKRLEFIFFRFFRIDSSKYILAGIENKKPFAVIIPDSSTWKQKYILLDIRARARDSNQPEVLITFTFKDIESKDEFKYELRIEVRWSHGKYSTVEAKINKFQWSFNDLVWVERLILNI